MTRALVIGNGESRAWFHPDDWCLPTNMESWGCNAIYRDGSLVMAIIIVVGSQTGM